MAFLQDIMPLDIGKGLLTRRRRMPDVLEIYVQHVRDIYPTRQAYMSNRLDIYILYVGQGCSCIFFPYSGIDIQISCILIHRIIYSSAD